jgi:hypothetical protein
MSLLVPVLVPAALYGAFLWWYGGRGTPLGADEIDAGMRALAQSAGHDQQPLLEQVRQLLTQDDGREFVMVNLVRYRPKALYPPGQEFGDDARAADRRYGRAILPILLRYGSMPVFIARRAGRFIEPPLADAWHYVAMVRYRSRRDFLRFAIAIEQRNITMHKWAALEKTHVFPLRPLASLVLVRTAVAVLLAVASGLTWLLVGVA